MMRLITTCRSLKIITADEKTMQKFQSRLDEIPKDISASLQFFYQEIEEINRVKAETKSVGNESVPGEKTAPAMIAWAARGDLESMLDPLAWQAFYECAQIPTIEHARLQYCSQGKTNLVIFVIFLILPIKETISSQKYFRYKKMKY